VGERPLTLKVLRKRLRAFDVSEDRSKGKGSHTVFEKDFPDGKRSFPVPTTRKDVAPCYVKGCRRAFRLTAEDGVTDAEFYGD